MSEAKKVKRITVTYTDGTSRDMEHGFSAEADNEGTIAIDFVGLAPGQFEALLFRMTNIVVQQQYQKLQEVAAPTETE